MSSSDGSAGATAERFLVGFHVRRHFGGPGHLEVAPGALVLTDRRGRRSVRHVGLVVRLERKRWEPPGTNRWLEVTDGETTAWATMGRRREARVVAVLEAAGFSVEPARP
ncbi:hypothetical protein [Nocardioides sp.]|uniref:hypothetical protein n=1 Tax=Nocardioides sp. TaxID=35761 RepID=UPI00271E3E27|nr:hypothetical protein [Nocardioides sp.]MDO9456695.1 hypothetical protein [Nocardioides sp.]